jgi:surfeit locus 1 family protein
MSARNPAAGGNDGGGALRRPRVVAALAFGAVGVAILLGLMTWQLQRLAWKEGLIATLESRLAQPPEALPADPDPQTWEFRRVSVTGRFTGLPGAHGFADAAYLTTIRPWGAGYRVVQPFETDDGRTLLIDRGYVPVAQKNDGGRAALPTPAPEGPLTVTGALRWPQDADFFADAAAGPADNVWLTRSVTSLAPLWGAEPLLIVAETPTGAPAASGDWPVPQPVTVNLPNDHLEYAVTWGGLAAVWAVMAGLLARREMRR